MDQDGDLDALYETQEFKQSQAVAAAALYYRNWLDYYGARLYDGAKQKELLTAAQKGFGEFAIGDQPGELKTESLLGRGLSYLELGDTASAMRDFQLVVDSPNATPERKVKARLAMLDAYSRAGRIQDTLRYSDELLRGGQLPSADAPLVRYVRLETLFDAADKSKGADAERYRREASSLMDTLRASGKGWSDKVDALMVARVDDPAAWAGKTDSPRVQWELARLMLVKNDYAGATPLLQQLVGSKDADAKAFQAEAHYWLGVGAFKSNDFATPPASSTRRSPPAAATGRRGALICASRPWRACDGAATSRSRAGRALSRGALHEFSSRTRTTRSPTRRATARASCCSQAATSLPRSMNTPGAGRSGVCTARAFRHPGRASELLKTDTDPPARTAPPGRDRRGSRRRRRAGEALQTQKTAGVALPRSRRGDAAARRLHQPDQRRGDEQVVVLLADFDKRFPDQKDLLPQAVRLRLGALLQLGRFAEAEQAVTQFGPALAAENRSEQLAALASGFRKASARRKTDGDAAGSAAAARTAWPSTRWSAAGVAPSSSGAAQLQEATGDLAAAEKSYAAIVPPIERAARVARPCVTGRGDRGRQGALGRVHQKSRRRRRLVPGRIPASPPRGRRRRDRGRLQAPRRPAPSDAGTTDADMRKDDHALRPDLQVGGSDTETQTQPHPAQNPSRPPRVGEGGGCVHWWS